VEKADLTIVVSTVGMRLEIGSREIIPLYPGSGVFFETGIFHAERALNGQHLANLTRKIPEEEILRLVPKWASTHGTGFELIHQEMVTQSHFEAVDAIERGLREGLRFGKIQDSPSLGYDW